MSEEADSSVDSRRQSWICEIRAGSLADYIEAQIKILEARMQGGYLAMNLMPSMEVQRLSQWLSFVSAIDDDVMLPMTFDDYQFFYSDSA